MNSIRLVSSFLVLTLSAFQSIAAMALTTTKQCFDLRGSWQNNTDTPVGSLTQLQEEAGASRFVIELSGSLAIETELLGAQVFHEPLFDPSCYPGSTSRRCENPDPRFGVTTTTHFETNGFSFNLVTQDGKFSSAKLTTGAVHYGAEPRVCYLN